MTLCNFFLLLPLIHKSFATSLIEMDLFKADTYGYNCYRLPNLLQMNTPGHLVAFGQGRKGKNCPDSGWMDSFVRISYDNGKNWSKQSLVYNNPAQQTMGTPTAIVDHDTDTIFLFMNPQHAGRDAHDGKRILLFNSTDGGHTWSDPRDMTSALVPDGWDNAWMGTQQGTTITLQDGKSKRLIMCANHHGSSSNGAHTVYSDDHGATWHNGKTLSGPGGYGIGECALAQTTAGVTMYGRIVYDNPKINASRRVLAFSNDFGVTFGDEDANAFPNNPGADAEGSFLEYNGTFLVGSAWGQVSSKNPGRHNYTVLMSNAVDGRTSTWKKIPGADPFSPDIQAEYSTMAVPTANPSMVFVMYERGDIYSQGVGPKSSLRLTQVEFPQ